MGKNVKEFLQKNALQLTIQLMGVFVLGLNTWFATKLVPLTERVITLENKVDAIDRQHNDILQSMIRKEDLDLVIIRIDKISARLDNLIALLIKP